MTTRRDPKLTSEQRLYGAAIDHLDQEIRRNIDRLGYLVLSEEGRQQTEDYIANLRNERDRISLARCYHGVVK